MRVFKPSDSAQRYRPVVGIERAIVVPAEGQISKVHPELQKEWTATRSKSKASQKRPRPYVRSWPDSAFAFYSSSHVSQ